MSAWLRRTSWSAHGPASWGGRHAAKLHAEDALPISQGLACTHSRR